MARGPAAAEQEQSGPDALPGVTLPRETSKLIGHEAAETVLLDAYRSGRMHHGWIFTGERGIGKATLAFRLARFLFAHPDPTAPDVAAAHDLSIRADHPAARRVAIGAHANLLHLQREWDDKSRRYKSELSVDCIRRIARFVGATAGEGGWRIVIVDPADEMNRSAANALLKNLEEPPRQTLFILISRSRGALLPTILSRCRTLALAPLSAEAAMAVLTAVAPGLPAGPDAATVAGLAGGSPRRLIELRQSGGAELYGLLLRAIESNDREAPLKIASLAGDAARCEQFLDLYAGYLNRRVRGVPEPVASNPPAAPIVTWAELWEKTTVSGREVDTYNLDRRQFVLDLLESSSAALEQSGTRPIVQSLRIP